MKKGDDDYHNPIDLLGLVETCDCCDCKRMHCGKNFVLVLDTENYSKKTIRIDVNYLELDVAQTYDENYNLLQASIIKTLTQPQMIGQTTPHKLDGNLCEPKMSIY